MLVRAIESSYSYSAERYSYSYSNGAIMTEPIFDHEKLDVYRLSIEYVAASYGTAKGLKRSLPPFWQSGMLA